MDCFYVLSYSTNSVSLSREVTSGTDSNELSRSKLAKSFEIYRTKHVQLLPRLALVEEAVLSHTSLLAKNTNRNPKITGRKSDQELKISSNI